MGKISTIKENILYFIESQNITKSSFYEKMEISPSNFKGNGLKSEIGGDKIVKILSIYSEINPTWLLTGEGPMLKQEVKRGEKEELSDTNVGLLDMQAKIIAGLERELASKDESIAAKDIIIGMQDLENIRLKGEISLLVEENRRLHGIIASGNNTKQAG